MAAVDRTTINTNPHATVITILENSSYIKDPRRASGNRNRKFVYRHEPDTTSFDFSLYPLIVCKPATKVKSRQSSDQSTQEIQWSQQLIVKTVMNGSGNNKDDQGVDDMLAIMDDLDQYFESTDVRSDFKADDLNFQDIETEQSLQEIQVDGKIVYETIYNLTYRTRLVVKDAQEKLNLRDSDGLLLRDSDGNQLRVAS